jgi:proteasome accessory factor C
VNDPIPRLRRILTMIPLLRSRPGISVNELGRELGASRKEILADLNRIFLCGVPPYLPHDYILVSNEGDHVSIDFADHFARPARLTLREALALKLAIETLPPLADEQQDAADALLEAVRELLQKGKGKAEQGSPYQLEKLDGHIEVPGSGALIEKLRALGAVLNKKREVKIAYYSASSNTLKERWIRPYALLDQGGNYYLVSYCLESEETRSFRVDRIQKILDTSGPEYSIPTSFDPKAAGAKIGLGSSDGHRVRARFSKEIAPWVREDYKDHYIQAEQDGRLVVEFRAGSIPWAVQKLLGYGELVEVLEPQSIKDELIRRLREIAA